MTSARRRPPSGGGNSYPIGMFDSGIGGLTVAKKIFELLPHENVIYFGDTARYPYGPRSKRIVRNFSFQNTDFLLLKRVKLVVVACNTASAVALDVLRKRYDIPMIGVVEPGARGALKATRNGRIGVIGTVGTINSGAYQKAILRLDPGLTVCASPCPLFASLVEEGYINKEATRLIAHEYLDPLLRKKVDTLVLGCTHYPLLKSVISKVMGKGTRLIDSAEETAREVKSFLEGSALLRNAKQRSFRKFYVSDVPDRFVQVGEKFLRAKIKEVKRVDIDSY
ncbi:MAG: glutamate racemase [Candidatus Zixiibacteriota bacterium]|nr:MAG: glutamate racemase [candidate division Zixibacteria bacterium]